MLEQLSAQAERAGEIIRRIRWFVKKNAPAKSPTNLNRAILDAIAFLESDAEAAEITLNLKLGDSLPVIDADSVQIQQVVINLVKNAIEALRTVHGGRRTIDIETSVIDGNLADIAVSDTGPGLPPEIAADLSNPS